MQINEIERYEIAAHAFKRMTGFMAPGKEPPMDSFEEPIERREEAWRYWNHTHGRIVTKILDGVCAVIPDHDGYDRRLKAAYAKLMKCLNNEDQADCLYEPTEKARDAVNKILAEPKAE